MNKMIFYRIFRSAAIFLYIFMMWTNFSSQNASYALTGFFAYDFTAYSITFIVLNILFGFLIGIGHIFMETDSCVMRTIRLRRYVILVVPLLYLALGMHVYSTFYNFNIVRILYMYAGIFHMTITESIGAYNATVILLISGYAMQIIIGYIIGKSTQMGMR